MAEIGHGPPPPGLFPPPAGCPPLEAARVALASPWGPLPSRPCPKASARPLLSVFPLGPTAFRSAALGFLGRRGQKHGSQTHRRCRKDPVWWAGNQRGPGGANRRPSPPGLQRLMASPQRCLQRLDGNSQWLPHRAPASTTLGRAVLARGPVAVPSALWPLPTPSCWPPPAGVPVTLGLSPAAPSRLAGCAAPHQRLHVLARGGCLLPSSPRLL